MQAAHGATVARRNGSEKWAGTAQTLPALPKKAMTRERASRQISARYAGLIAARIDAGETGSHPVLPLANLKIWQGWKESNLRMPESKSGALTNLATPLHGTVVVANNRPINRSFLFCLSVV
jgi:hypothetical protein